jgi:hypothetical protein
VSSLQAEKAAMQDTAQELISALEAANLQLRQAAPGGSDAAALRDELAAMTVPAPPSLPVGCQILPLPFKFQSNLVLGFNKIDQQLLLSISAKNPTIKMSE